MILDLKHTDKLIILIAVAVVIIAVISLALYQPPEEEVTEPQTETHVYDVEWNIKSDSLPSISGGASKKASYTTDIIIPQGNLKTITFNLSWEDDKPRLRFLKRLGLGLDEITLKITTPDGTVETRSSKNGRIELSLDVNLEEPSNEPIEAESIFDAEQKLREPPYYSDKWENKEINIQVSVKVGKIGMFRDKGNTFSLEVSYEYYDGSLIEIQPEEKSTDTDGNFLDDLRDTEYTPPTSWRIIGMGFGRLI